MSDALGIQPGVERSDEFVAEGQLLTTVGGTIGVAVLSTPPAFLRRPIPSHAPADLLPTEVERAIDNLYKSGKMPVFSGGPGMPPVPGVPRRDSMPPMGGRPYGEFGKSALPPAAFARRRN